MKFAIYLCFFTAAGCADFRPNYTGQSIDIMRINDSCKFVMRSKMGVVKCEI